jgi:6-hydroxytryprostatin B O-methyltransferase
MTANTSQHDIKGLIGGSSPLELLVLDLIKQTKALVDYLRDNQLPEPSFERNAPIISFPPQAPEEVQMAKEKLLDDAVRILQLVTGPGEHVQSVMASVSIPIA